MDAWTAAIRRVESKASTAANHPTDALRPAIYRLALFKPCTSRVEQDFSRIDQILGSKRLGGLDSTEDDITKVGGRSQDRNFKAFARSGPLGQSGPSQRVGPSFASEPGLRAQAA